MPMRINCVLKSIEETFCIQGLARVLWINAAIDLVVLIEIPLKGKHGGSPSYFRRPFRQKLSAIAPLENTHFVVIELKQRPITLMTDEEIEKRYPQRVGKTKRKERKRSAMLQTRDSRWERVEEIVHFIEQNLADTFETPVVEMMIGDRIKAAKGKKRSIRSEIYDSLHRTLALGEGKNSLLPNRTLCGGPLKTRVARPGGRLGRPNALVKAGVIDGGISLTPEDKAKLAHGYAKFIKGRSVDDAYLLTMGTFWNDGFEVKNGEALAILKPPHLRPTLAQFRYWGGPRAGGDSAFRAHIQDDAWDRNYREKTGSRYDKIRAIGQVGFADASGVKVNFVSSTSFLKATGPGHKITIHDGMSDVVSGYYLGFEAPSERTVHLAVVNSAMDKVSHFERFGIHITSDQMPAVFYFKLRADNGELRNLGSMETLKAVGCAAEFVQTKRAERKGPVESGHRSLHRSLDDKIDGATRGKSSQRGVEHSAIPADWTWFKYMVDFLKWIIFYNCEDDATAIMRAHPFRVEMARDGVKPTRAAIFAWCASHHHVAMPAYEPDSLLARLLPVFDAVVKQNGVWLLRPDRGDKSEIVYGPRYSGQRAMELRWHEGNRTNFHIKVRVNPSDLSCIWYLDDLGVHRLDDKSGDSTRRRDLTLDEHLMLLDEEHYRRLSAAAHVEQAKSNFITGRENSNLANRAAKKKEIDSSPKKVTKTQLKANVKENRAEEARRVESQISPITRSPISAKLATQDPDGVVEGDGPSTALDDPPSDTNAPSVSGLDTFRSKKRGRG